jgi:hypothetical protein
MKVHTRVMTSELVTTIDIDAPPAAVWAVLTDTAAYPEWNPFVRELSGELVAGGRLRVRIGAPGRRAVTLHPRIVRIEAEQELTWLGRVVIPRLFDGRHSFVLEERPGGGTRFIQSEHFRGVLVPLMGRLLRSTGDGFDAMNQALRVRSEARLHTSTAT